MVLILHFKINLILLWSIYFVKIDCSNLTWRYSMPTVTRKFLDQSEIKSIARALGDTSDGLTGSEITHFLQQAKIPDIDSSSTKWIRLFSAFCKKQGDANTCADILEFIRQAMKPANFIRNQDRYQVLRSNLNAALAFCGLEVKETGELVACEKASTLTEAELRANKLKINLQERNIHPDVIKFCKAELLQNNYFHAVFEAVKSVFDKLRKRTGFIDDGHKLADKCLGGDNPKIKINALKTESEKVEQRGFHELIKGVYSMFRSPLSHEAKINWEVTQRDAEDLFTMLSMIHRRIDASNDSL